MSRHHRPATDLIEFIENRPAQRRSFDRISAGPEFVEQYEALRIGGLEDVSDA